MVPHYLECRAAAHVVFFHQEKKYTPKSAAWECFKRHVFDMVLLPIKIISLILSQVNRKVGQKQEILREKTPITRKQNLACLTWNPS